MFAIRVDLCMGNILTDFTPLSICGEGRKRRAWRAAEPCGNMLLGRIFIHLCLRICPCTKCLYAARVRPLSPPPPQQKKRAPTLWVRIFLLWRRRRDSNPCGLAPKRFSRPPRYDHFDTPPYAAIIVECSCIVNGRKGILPAYMFGLNVRIQQYHLVAFDGRSAISAIIIELVEYAETVLLIKIDRRGI